MRISTSVFFDTGSSRITDLQTSLSRVQEQLSANRRILTPSDDPVAAAQALVVSQSKAVNSQYGVNRQTATDALSLEESVLQGVTSLLQDVKTRVVEAGSGTLDDTQRKFIASELSGRLDELIGMANTRDGEGNYMFAGYRNADQPFVKVEGGARYDGDQGQRMLQVGSQRQIALGDSGSVVFETIRTGNGTFSSAPKATNSGSGIISNGSVVNPQAITRDTYEIRFINGGAAYDVVNITAVPEVAVSTGNTYTSGTSISLPGMQVDITGSPADGDQFVVEPSRNQDIFKTLSNLITALNTPASDAAGKAKLTNALNAANSGVSNALDHVLTVRASVGARLNELEALDSQGDDIDLRYAESLRNLQDLDYTKAISDLMMQKFMLEASQQAFVKTSGMSLFNFI